MLAASVSSLLLFYHFLKTISRDGVSCYTAVDCGLIDSLGGLSNAVNTLYSMIDDYKSEKNMDKEKKEE